MSHRNTITEALNRNLRGKWFHSGGSLWHAKTDCLRMQVKPVTMWYYPPSGGRKCSYGRHYVLLVSHRPQPGKVVALGDLKLTESFTLGHTRGGIDFSKVPSRFRSYYRSQGRIRKGAA